MIRSMAGDACPSQAQVFYDTFVGKFLADYLYGNPRLEASIRHATQWIPRHAKRILDVGCGIGWSTSEIKRNFPEAFVLGIDFSSQVIETATKLFGAPQLAFRVCDICRVSGIDGDPFDAIVMGDVYEHVPRDDREKVHHLLRRTLDAQGRIILTFPSLPHQNFLRRCAPETLQPVDEDVTINDVGDLARAVDGHIACYMHVGIWRTNDYVHAVIERNPGFEDPKSKTKRVCVPGEPYTVRRKRLSSRLGLRVTRHGTRLPDRDGPVVCVISPNQDTYSETFVRAHIERLPATVRLLYGGWFPTFTEDGSPLLSIHTGPRIVRACARRLLRLPPEYFPTRALARFLRSNGIDVVLSEYGPTGVAVLDACMSGGIPLAVHFHGFDAYHYPTLESYRPRYERMFLRAAAVIAVSRDMERVLLSLGAQRERVFYCPYGVDPSVFSGGDPGAAAPVFVAVGRFVEKKAPHLTLLAFREVRKACPEARLIMVGDGELWGATRHLARALGIADAVEFLGPRSHSEVAAILRKARAFVQHSMRAVDGDSEGTPVAVLEAGATGLPVVATCHGGIREAVIHDETGFLVAEGDVAAMADYMIRLAEDRELAAALGRRARGHIQDNFSMQKSIATLWGILEGVAGKKG